MHRSKRQLKALGPTGQHARIDHARFSTHNALIAYAGQEDSESGIVSEASVCEGSMCEGSVWEDCMVESSMCEGSKSKAVMVF